VQTYPSELANVYLAVKNLFFLADRKLVPCFASNQHILANAKGMFQLSAVGSPDHKFDTVAQSHEKLSNC
jgi:hypothetical protein